MTSESPGLTSETPWPNFRRGIQSPLQTAKDQLLRAITEGVTGVEQLSREIGKSERTTFRCLNELIRENRISVHKEGFPCRTHYLPIILYSSNDTQPKTASAEAPSVTVLPSSYMVGSSIGLPTRKPAKPQVDQLLALPSWSSNGRTGTITPPLLSYEARLALREGPPNTHIPEEHLRDVLDLINSAAEREMGLSEVGKFVKERIREFSSGRTIGFIEWVHRKTWMRVFLQCSRCGATAEWSRRMYGKPCLDCNGLMVELARSPSVGQTSN